MGRALPLGLLSAALLCRSGLAVLFSDEHRPKQRRSTNGTRDLVLMHIPYNFGHSVELEALTNWKFGFQGGFNGKSKKASGFIETKFNWPLVRAMKGFKSDAEVWGHFHPDLQETNEVTGCPMYFSPQKFWPKELAQKYFGNKTVFGMLRDPYERLNSFFRGSFSAYGGSYPEFYANCDVNSAVKKMMKDVIAQNDIFKDRCTFIPQAEYFDGEYGITLPIDNRRFPSSMNEVFEKHGYKFHVDVDEIPHVRGCDNVWAGDFDKETKALVKQVYKRDFELLCKHFNYCTDEEEVCIPEVPYMCPLNHFQWNDATSRYERKD